MNLDSGNGNFCYDEYPRVTSSLLAKSNINFVIKVMEERCGKCGILNDGPKLNTHPWIVALRESPPGTKVPKYYTGTLVSRQWVVTEASIFVNINTATQNFEVLVGAKAFRNNANDRWEPISEVKRHPKYYSRNYKYDVAMVKLKTRILDPVPHPSDVKYDTIRPICLPDFEADILTNRKSYLYDKEVLNSRLLTAEKARIISYGECKNALSDTRETLQEYVFIKQKFCSWCTL